MLIGFLISAFLIFLNGFFVAAEFAIVKVRASQIEIYAPKESWSRSIALRMTDHLDAYLAATQLGVTIASIGLGWVAEGTFAELIRGIFSSLHITMHPLMLHKISFIVSFAFVTFLHVVFGELAPKSLSIRYALKITLLVAIPLQIFYYIFMPFIWLFNGFANFILKLMGVSKHQEHETHSEEELRLIIDESREEGRINANEHELIQHVFEFDNYTVKQILVPRTQIYAVEINTPVDTLLQQCLDEGFTRIPVFEKTIDNIKGIIHIKDLLKLLHNPEQTLKDVLRQPFFVPSNKRISNLLRDFQRTNTQMAIVMDEYGGTLGIVTLEDIIEELVGEINDEFDEEEKAIEQTGEGEFTICAQTDIVELNRSLPFPLPVSGEYQTLSGLMVQQFGRIPEVGEKITLENYSATITKKNRNVITAITLEIVPKE
ncbi:MAG: hemolysin family protein [Bacteroidales bacterium]|jgi:CBS domain containing-hemolysin-like protein|nr:hemolysin family protein [Bacteroidales bacterium]